MYGIHEGCWQKNRRAHFAGVRGLVCRQGPERTTLRSFWYLGGIWF